MVDKNLNNLSQIDHKLSHTAPFNICFYQYLYQSSFNISYKSIEVEQLPHTKTGEAEKPNE
jgi:hypothetical protein